MDDNYDYQSCSTPLGRNPYYMIIYVFWSKFILMEIIPYIGIISLNVLIAKAILYSNKFQRQNTRQDLTTQLSTLNRGKYENTAAEKTVNTPST